jgi:uncharacterized protein (DUF1697 family)
MASINITLSEDLKVRLRARAQESGYQTVEQYIQAVLEANAQEAVLDDDLEELLTERMNNAQPGIELNEQFKSKFRQEVQSRRDTQGH